MSRPSRPSDTSPACRSSSSWSGPDGKSRWARSRRPWRSRGRPCRTTSTCSGGPGSSRAGRKSGTSTIPCSGRRRPRSRACSPPAARGGLHVRQSPSAHARIRPRQEPRLLRAVPRRGPGQGQDGVRQVSARMGARQPRRLGGRSRRRGHGEPRGRAAGDRGRRYGAAHPREVRRLARARGDGGQLLPRQPGQVLGPGPGRRGVGGLPPQLRSRGRGHGRREARREGTATGKEQYLLRVFLTTRHDRRPAMADQDIKQIVRDKYGKAALKVTGGGSDVLLSARRVGPTGKAYGLDMTDEMLALARENQRKAGVSNVEFLKGEIEAIPLPDDSVDVIISNCVINLSADKDRVFAAAFRVLKPGGRL